MPTQRRVEQWKNIDDRSFDVAVIGGGINGAALSHLLRNEGYSVVLLDKRDIGGGTSQASAMMIWGGLLYLKNLDVPTVLSLCRARDEMVRVLPDWVAPRRFRYITASMERRPSWWIQAALHTYWLLGGCRRARPLQRNSFSEDSMIRRKGRRACLEWEEAHVDTSDARFVLHMALPRLRSNGVTMNYCAVRGAEFDSAARRWHLSVHDTILDRPGCVRARSVVNAAGVWTDEINKSVGIDTPYRHVMSKGVFIGLPRDSRHESPLFFETRHNGDVMSLNPWGPVSLWGPTETVVDDPRGSFEACPEEVRSLLEELNRHLVEPHTVDDVVSLRVGVRPLAVRRNGAVHGGSLELSRRHRIHLDKRRPWCSVHGGKLTGCVRVARRVSAALRKCIGHPPPPGSNEPLLDECSDWIEHPAFEYRVPSPRWCADRELCWTLEDYLRRRTNIAQWVPRGGLGKNNEHQSLLEHAAAAFQNGTGLSARDAVERYRRTVSDRFDTVLAQC